MAITQLDTYFSIFLWSHPGTMAIANGLFLSESQNSKIIQAGPEVQVLKIIFQDHCFFAYAL